MNSLSLSQRLNPSYEAPEPTGACVDRLSPITTVCEDATSNSDEPASSHGPEDTKDRTTDSSSVDTDHLSSECMGSEAAESDTASATKDVSPKHLVNGDKEALLSLFSNGPVFPSRQPKNKDLTLSPASGLDLSTSIDHDVQSLNLEFSSAAKKAIISYIDAAKPELLLNKANSLNSLGSSSYHVRNSDDGICNIPSSCDVASSPQDSLSPDNDTTNSFLKTSLSTMSADIEGESLPPLSASLFSCQYQTPVWIDDPLVGVPPSAMENKNTHRKTGADMRILTAYMRSLNEMRLPEAIPPTELDKYLSSFFLVVRKADGSEYEPCSLRAMLASIERYLRFKNYPLSLTRDSAFSNMRNVLKLKQQTLRSIGKGQKTPNEVSPSSLAREGKIAHLFKSQEMGPYTPSSVVFTLCFYFCMYLRLRKSTENKKLLWGDIMLCKDENGREFLTFSSQMLRRTQGSSKMNLRQKTYRVWAEPSCPEKDPVTIYKFYAQKRPASMNTNFAPFYLGINVLYPTQGQMWYRPAAMGINKLNEMVRQIRDITGVRNTSNFNSGMKLIERHILEADLISHGNQSYADVDDRRDPHVDVKSEIMEDSDEEDANSTLAIDFSQDPQPPPLDCSQSNFGLSALAAVPTNADIADGDSSSDSFSQQSFPSHMNGAEILDMRTGDEDPHDLTKDDDTDCPLNCSTKDRTLYNHSNTGDSSVTKGSSPALSLQEAKHQLLDMVQKMCVSDMQQFNHWLQGVRFCSDPVSGLIMCQEDDSQPGKSMSVQASSSNSPAGASITLNICLTPQALQGQGPITVTAQTSLSPQTSLSKTSCSPEQQRNFSSSTLNHPVKSNLHYDSHQMASSKIPALLSVGKTYNHAQAPPGQVSVDKPLDLATGLVSRSTKLSSSSSQSIKSNWSSGTNGMFNGLTSTNCSSPADLDSPLAKRLRLSAEQAEAYTSASIMASLSSASFISERLRLQLMQAGLPLGDYGLDANNLMEMTNTQVMRSQLLQHYGIKSEPK